MRNREINANSYFSLGQEELEKTLKPMKDAEHEYVVEENLIVIEQKKDFPGIKIHLHFEKQKLQQNSLNKISYNFYDIQLIYNNPNNPQLAPRQFKKISQYIKDTTFRHKKIDIIYGFHLQIYMRKVLEINEPCQKCN